MRSRDTRNHRRLIGVRMSFDVTGKLHEIYPEQQVTEKFRKREFVLETQDGMYQQYIKFQMTQDRCS
ncbi:MAG: DUF3127 domain-containing protein, partial [Candidatus Kapaibacterium sp.]